MSPGAFGIREGQGHDPAPAGPAGGRACAIPVSTCSSSTSTDAAATGELELAFVVDNATTTFQPVIGPKDRRVLLLTNAKQNHPAQPVQLAVFSGNYREQLTWRDAATGRILVESGFFEPLTLGSLITPGFGGRVYFPTGEGFVTMQVKPKAAKR